MLNVPMLTTCSNRLLLLVPHFLQSKDYTHRKKKKVKMNGKNKEENE